MTKSKVRLHKSKQETRKNVANEINFLQQRIAQETPAQGYAPPITQRVAFRALPISDATLRGLEAGEFTIMTAIQNACLPHALAGRDILGAARTGRCVRYRESE
jgi:ATP-dependent RNA helicase DDX10/DBP4